MDADGPPKEMIESARLAAVLSPCEKSKRGAVVYTDAHLDGSKTLLYSSGFNSPPDGIECFGTPECRKHCAMRCNHAEERALMALLRLPALELRRRSPGDAARHGPLVMLHVKVVDENVVAGGGPGCAMCSRAILDSGIIHGIWLFQSGQSATSRINEPDRWVYWEARDFHRETCAALGIP